MLQYMVAGLVIGGIYAIAAAGVVVTYVSTGILNFAFGSLAYFVARCYYWLHTEHQWHVVPAGFVAIVIVGPLLGVFLHYVLFRYVRLAPAVVKVVVTIGVSVTIPPLCNVLFGLKAILRAPGLAPEPVHVYHVLGTPVTSDQAVVYIAVALIVVVGALVLRFTEIGLSVRAMVDSEAMTSLSGTNPSRVSMTVWAVSTGMAGLAGVLAAPAIGLDPDNFTLIVAGAFAAVVAARLRSLPIAVAVALAMGVAGALVQYFMPPTSSVTAAVLPSIPFAFIVVFLLFHMLRHGEVSETQGVGGALDRSIRPHGGSQVAAGEQASRADEGPPVVRRVVGPVLVFGLVALIPLVASSFWAGFVGYAAALGIAFLASTLVAGEGGMIWLCQITFTGIGAVSTAQFATIYGWPLPLAILGAASLAAVIGVLVGLLTIRLGDLYVTLVTLTFGLLMERMVFAQRAFSLFGVGVPVKRPSLLDGGRAFAWFALAVFAVVAVLIVNLRRSTTGMALAAVRWSVPASRTMGLSVVQMKLTVAGLGAFVAAIGGGLLACYTGVALPDTYATFGDAVWLAVVATFGMRSNTAALLAAMAFTYSPVLSLTYLSTTWAQWPPVLFGLGAVLLARSPEGATATWSRAVSRLVGRAVRRAPAPA